MSIHPNCILYYRFSPEDMTVYSAHLDWHFRAKRRERDNARKAQSRWRNKLYIWLVFKFLLFVWILTKFGSWIQINLIPFGKEISLTRVGILPKLWKIKMNQKLFFSATLRESKILFFQMYSYDLLFGQIFL